MQFTNIPLTVFFLRTLLAITIKDQRAWSLVWSKSILFQKLCSELFSFFFFFFSFVVINMAFQWFCSSLIWKQNLLFRQYIILMFYENKLFSTIIKINIHTHKHFNNTTFLYYLFIQYIYIYIYIYNINNSTENKYK